MAGVESEMAGEKEKREVGEKSFFSIPAGGIVPDAIASLTGTPLFIIDSEGLIQYANRASMESFGLKCDTSDSYAHISDILHEDDLIQVLQYHTRRREKNTAVPDRYIARIVDSDGSYPEYLLQVTYMPEREETLITAMKVSDIHGPNIHSPAGGEEGYQRYLDTLPDGVIVIQGDDITYMNAAAGLMMSSDPEQGAGASLFLDLQDHDFNSLIEDCTKTSGKRSVSVKSLEDVLITSDGKEKNVEILSVPVSLGGKRGTELIIRDISRQKRAQEDISSRNKQLQTINELVRAANSVDTLEGMLEEMIERVVSSMRFDFGWVYLRNPEAKYARLIAPLGVPQPFIERHGRQNTRDFPYNLVFFATQPHYVENLRGRSPGPIDTKILEDLDALCYAGIPLIADSVVVGGLYVGRRDHWSFTPSEKETLELIGREIGGSVLRAMLQERLEDAYNDASLYLDIMLHDIKNANAAILGYSRHLREIYHPEGLQFADKVLWHTHHITDILNNVTTIRRITEVPGEMTPIHLDALIAAEISQYPDADISFRKTGCYVWADSLLSDVFANLIRNSIKYGGPGVRIWISGEESDHEITISVEDDGPGIPDDKKSRIFSYFQENLNESGGRGLGLHISRLLVRRYGGKIRPEDRINGKPEEGLAIRFTLQVYGEDEELTRHQSSPS
jgi:PAS domain S-box-containing protein